ncbi:hypothetical protein B0T16DRAFT_388619 [Cercophora newfieldiana]|uniref:Uncharacterized protein n=1 Tax=Cercophora newfieldiana TaxID=92897 RepID=A0AA39Y974_9PEZI|nr:hypothetical protein B0T16DRAFT_388619 [Cercophora newfieldiana]
MLVLAFGAAHVLFFAALWSTATGYKASSVVGFVMSDRSWIVKTSSELRMCWELDSRRLGDLGLTDDIVLGPQFGSVFNGFDSMGRGMWDMYHTQPNRKSEHGQFDDLYSYARSKNTLKTFLNQWNASMQHIPFDNGMSIVSWDERVPYDSNNRIYGFHDIEHSNTWARGSGLPASINGWQFLDRKTAEWAKDLILINHPDSYGKATQEPYLRTTFHLDNDTVSSNEEGIPYTSVIWIGDKHMTLRASFLELGANCSKSWFPSDLGECLCYKGKPLTEDFRGSQEKFCTGGETYMWGFSSSLATTGLILEAAWSAICFGLWIGSSQNSKAIQSGRSTTGDVRNMVDLSEAIKIDLGQTTGWEKDGQLLKALSKCPPVGLEIKKRQGDDSLGTLTRSLRYEA